MYLISTKLLLYSLLLVQSLTAINEALDTSFNPLGAPPGSVITSFQSDSTLNDMVLSNNNQRIIAVGTNGQFALARYHITDGELDTSFGIEGRVVTPFDKSNKSAAQAIAVDAQGRLVVAGVVQYLNGAGVTTQRFAVARYLSDGTLDETFNAFGEQPGTITTSFADSVLSSGAAIAIDPSDGGIIVGGRTIHNERNALFALARYTDAGLLDTSFGGKESGDKPGTVTTQFSTGSFLQSSISSVLVLPNRNIVAIGTFTQTQLDGSFALAQYRPDGSLDESFGEDGKVLTTFNPGASGAIGGVLQDDGKIVVAGFTAGLAGGVVSTLTRYSTNGSLDRSFGEQGKVLNVFGEQAQAGAIALDNNQHIIVAGNAFSDVVGHAVFGVIRYSKNGIPMSPFVEVAFKGSLFAASNAVMVQPDDKIIVGGYSQSSFEGLTFALARFVSNLPGPLKSFSSLLTQAIQEKYC